MEKRAELRGIRGERRDAEKKGTGKVRVLNAEAAENAEGKKLTERRGIRSLVGVVGVMGLRQRRTTLDGIVRR